MFYFKGDDFKGAEYECFQGGDSVRFTHFYPSLLNVIGSLYARLLIHTSI